MAEDPQHIQLDSDRSFRPITNNPDDPLPGLDVVIQLLYHAKEAPRARASLNKMIALPITLLSEGPLSERKIVEAITLMGEIGELLLTASSHIELTDASARTLNYVIQLFREHFNEGNKTTLKATDLLYLAGQFEIKSLSDFDRQRSLTVQWRLQSIDQKVPFFEPKRMNILGVIKVNGFQLIKFLGKKYPQPPRVALEVKKIFGFKVNETLPYNWFQTPTKISYVEASIYDLLIREHIVPQTRQSQLGSMFLSVPGRGCLFVCYKPDHRNDALIHAQKVFDDILATQSNIDITSLELHHLILLKSDISRIERFILPLPIQSIREKLVQDMHGIRRNGNVAHFKGNGFLEKIGLQAIKYSPDGKGNIIARLDFKFGYRELLITPDHHVTRYDLLNDPAEMKNISRTRQFIEFTCLYYLLKIKEELQDSAQKKIIKSSTVNQNDSTKRKLGSSFGTVSYLAIRKARPVLGQEITLEELLSGGLTSFEDLRSFSAKSEKEWREQIPDQIVYALAMMLIDRLAYDQEMKQNHGVSLMSLNNWFQQALTDDYSNIPANQQEKIIELVRRCREMMEIHNNRDLLQYSVIFFRESTPKELKDPQVHQFDGNLIFE